MANRTILGRNQHNNYGLYISKSGQDVLTASTPDHYLFNSDYNSGAIVHASGLLTNGATATFANLPYVPLVMSWGINPSTGRQEGRVKLNMGETYRYYVPGISEYEYEYRFYSYEGPLVQVTTNSVKYLGPSSFNGWNPSRSWNCRYVVLRVPGGA